MSQTAAHLVDHVIPYVPVREWVELLPIPPCLLQPGQLQLITLVLQTVRDAPALPKLSTRRASRGYGKLGSIRGCFQTESMLGRHSYLDSSSLSRRGTLLGALGLLALPALRAASSAPQPDPWPRALPVPGGVARVSLGAAAPRPSAHDGDVPLLVLGDPAGGRFWLVFR